MYKYKFPNGNPCRHPTTYEQACEVKARLYDDGQECPECRSRHHIKYTKTRACVSCSKLSAINLMHLHKGIYKYIWTDGDERHWAEPSPGHVVRIDDEDYDEMLGYCELVNSDHDFTITDQPCSTHGHYGIKRLGKCYQCQLKRKERTPRQKALHDGETWYMPNTDCPKCGQRALKNVHNGACQGCTPLRAEPVDNSTAVLMRENADMILSKEDAELVGLKVYRTGKECINGHTGWRYVSTGNCLDCRKES